MYSLDDDKIIYTSLNGEKYVFKPCLVVFQNKFGEIFDIVNSLLTNNPELANMYDQIVVQSMAMPNAIDRYRFFLLQCDEFFKMLEKAYLDTDPFESLVVKERPEFKLSITRADTKTIFLTSIRLRFFLFATIMERYVEGEVVVDDWTQEKKTVNVYEGELRLRDEQIKSLNEVICKPMLDSGAYKKICNMIEALVMNTKPNNQGKSVWSMMRDGKGYDPAAFIVELITSVFYKALPSLDATINPIGYIKSVAESELNWMIHTFLTTVIVPTNVVSMNAPKQDMLESEIFYRTLVRKIFGRIAEEYKPYAAVYKHNVYCLLTGISQILVTKVFGCSIANLNLSNTHVINFWVHKFLMIHDPKKVNLLELLVSTPIVDPTRGSKNKEKELPPDLRERIEGLIETTQLHNYITRYSTISIVNKFCDTIAMLRKHRFYDAITHREIKVNWFLLASELIDYTLKILSGQYDKAINDLRTKELDTWDDVFIDITEDRGEGFNNDTDGEVAEVGF